MPQGRSAESFARQNVLFIGAFLTFSAILPQFSRKSGYNCINTHRDFSVALLRVYERWGLRYLTKFQLGTKGLN